MKIVNAFDPEIVALMTGPGKDMSRSVLAEKLTALGFVSRSGLELTKDHVSNLGKENPILRKVEKYEKPGYKGSNHIVHTKRREDDERMADQRLSDAIKNIRPFLQSNHELKDVWAGKIARTVVAELQEALHGSKVKIDSDFFFKHARIGVIEAFSTI